MTRKNPDDVRGPKGRLSKACGHWKLQDAKARFSELVRRAHHEGPQHVTVHGRDEVVVVSAEEFHRLKGDRSGRLLIELMRDSPLRDIEFEPAPVHSPVRDVKL
jgi:prevent-host-death family protein